MKKKRIIYISAAAAVLAAEMIIGVFVHDRFVRPYIGDVLVTVLLCCLWRCVFPNKPKHIAPFVFAFASLTELSQLLRLDELLGVEGTVAGIILGSTFDPRDIICYAVGCLLFGAAELLADANRTDG